MKAILMTLRIVASLALLLGLTYLFGIQLPFRTVDIHMLLGIIAVVCAQVIGVRLMSPQGIGGAVLGLVLLMLGVGLRTGWWSGDAIGLLHLAVALGMVALIEVAAAKARRAERVAS